jgi:hypothetical protein
LGEQAHRRERTVKIVINCRKFYRVSYEKWHLCPLLSAVVTIHITREVLVLKFLLGAFGAVAIVGGAVAADLPRSEPPPPPAPIGFGKAPIGKLPFGKAPVVARY